MMGLKKGEIVCLTYGAYSDFMVVGHFRALRDISDEEWNALRAQHDSRGDAPQTATDFGDRTNVWAFTAEMTRLGWVEDALEVCVLAADDRLEERERYDAPPPEGETP